MYLTDSEILEVASDLSSITRSRFEEALVEIGLYSISELRGESNERVEISEILIKRDFYIAVIRSLNDSDCLDTLLGLLEIDVHIDEVPMSDTSAVPQTVDKEAGVSEPQISPELDQEPIEHRQARKRTLSIAALIALVGGIFTIFSFPLDILKFLYGDNICQNPNPPQFLAPVLNIVCADETLGPESSTGIVATRTSLSMTSVASLTPSPEGSPTQIQTLTATLELTLTPELSQSTRPCFVAGEDFWQATWLGNGGLDPLRSREVSNIACFDFSDEGLFIEPADDGIGYQLSIRCDPSENSCGDWQTIRGIFTPLSIGEFSFRVKIENTEILDEEADPRDVDLILGIGDPISATGKFIFLRLVNPDGKIHICSGPGYQIFCSPITTTGLASFNTHTITISVDEYVNVEFDGTALGDPLILQDEYRVLWIGYSIRSRGLLYATIQFPDSLSHLLSIDE